MELNKHIPYYVIKTEDGYYIMNNWNGSVTTNFIYDAALLTYADLQEIKQLYPEWDFCATKIEYDIARGIAAYKANRRKQIIRNNDYV
jgi:hypothetical protein